MFGRALNSLEYRVEREEEEWRTTNRVRQDLAYPHVQKAILEIAEHSIRYAPMWLVLGLGLSGLAWGSSFEFKVLGGKPYNSEEIISYLTALWAIQATVVALVYPIVIGFVALLFQGRYNAKAVLYIYLHDTASLLAGLNSLALIALMGIHHLLTPKASSGVVLVWSALDSVWFLINMCLTGFFLVRTFEFLLPDKRALILQRYAVNVAWPNELRTHLSVAFFASAVMSKWLPGTSFGQEGQERQPKVLLGSAGLGMGAIASTIVVARNVHLVDVWFRPLSWAIRLWLKRARGIQSPAEAAGRLAEYDAPLIIFPVVPGSQYSDEVTLCRVDGRVPLTRLEAWLVRLSFRFGHRRKRPFDLPVSAVLDDIEADARQAIARDDGIAYEEKVNELTGLYSILLQASICKNTDNQDDNYTRVSDSAHWFGTPVFKSWSRTFLNLFEAVTGVLDVKKSYVAKLAYVPTRLFSHLLERGHEDILLHMIRLLPIFHQRIGNWWQRMLEQQGIPEHGPCFMQLLPPPHRGVYESVMIDIVGAWSSLKNDQFPPHRSEKPNWEELCKSAPYFQAHISDTAMMLLNSVLRGDQASAEWCSDLMLKWWDQLEYRFDRGTLLLRRERFLTIELTKERWANVQARVDIESFRVSEDAPRGVFAVCLRNLWVDACCVAMYVLVLWGRSCGDCERSLAARILHALLKGEPFREGGTIRGNLCPIPGPSDLLVAMVRQYYAAGGFRTGYRAVLDKWVEEIAGLTKREWVSGWSYSSRGADDLESLRDGQITLLTLLISPRWDPVRNVDEALRRWVREDEEKLRELGHDLEQWAKRLNE